MPSLTTSAILHQHGKSWSNHCGCRDIYFMTPGTKKMVRLLPFACTSRTGESLGEREHGKKYAWKKHRYGKTRMTLCQKPNAIEISISEPPNFHSSAASQPQKHQTSLSDYDFMLSLRLLRTSMSHDENRSHALNKQLPDILEISAKLLHVELLKEHIFVGSSSKSQQIQNDCFRSKEEWASSKYHTP